MRTEGLWGLDETLERHFLVKHNTRRCELSSLPEQDANKSFVRLGR